MFQRLTLRSKLLAIVAPPLVALVAVAVYAVMLSTQPEASATGLAGDIRNLGLVCAAASFVGALVVVLVGRSISAPLSQLADAAEDLADNRVPALVASLSDPRAAEASFPPIEIESGGDEVGRLVVALNAVQASLTHEVREQRSVIQAGVSDMVVNVARRNQALVDREIDLIGQVKSGEQDPHRMQALRQLDQLASRLRRGAESLLVLAGSPPTRRPGQPVPMEEVLRGALSEIEAYRRIDLARVDAIDVNAQAGADLTHLVSELLENATAFSPPETAVSVIGALQDDGSFVITITDAGLGLDPAKLRAANELLDHPGDLGLGLSRTLGLQIVARLATRIGARVQLNQASSGGTCAGVLVPAGVLGARAVPGASIDPAQTSDPAAELPDLSDQAVASDTPTPADIQKEALAELLADQEPSTSPSAASDSPRPDAAVGDSEPASDPGESGEHTAPATPASRKTTPIPPLPPTPSDLSIPRTPPDSLAQAVPEGDAFDQGLASLLPGESEATDGGPAKRNPLAPPAPASQGLPAAPSGRSPSEIRKLLTRYRSGRTAAGQQPPNPGGRQQGEHE